MSNEYREAIRKQNKGDKRIDYVNFGNMVDKVNALGRGGLAPEDVEMVRKLGSHTEIVLRQKPLAVFFANAATLALDVNDNISWTGANYYICDAEYLHDTSSDAHLVTFLAGGRYAVDLVVNVSCEVTTRPVGGMQAYVDLAAMTDNDSPTNLNIFAGYDRIVAAAHELAHDHGAAVASDLTTYYHRDAGLWIHYGQIVLSFIIDPVEDLTDGELFFRVTSLQEDSRAWTFRSSSTLRIMKIG